MVEGEHVVISRRGLFGLAAVGIVVAAWLGRARLGDALVLPAARGGRVLFGAWVPGGPSSSRHLERLLGRMLDVEHWYQGWGAQENGFDLVRARGVTARGA